MLTHGTAPVAPSYTRRMQAAFSHGADPLRGELDLRWREYLDSGAKLPDHEDRRASSLVCDERANPLNDERGISRAAARHDVLVNHFRAAVQ
jgi:hypothetical protein